MTNAMVRDRLTHDDCSTRFSSSTGIPRTVEQVAELDAMLAVRRPLHLDRVVVELTVDVDEVVWPAREALPQEQGRSDDTEDVTTPPPRGVRRSDGTLD